MKIAKIFNHDLFAVFFWTVAFASTLVGSFTHLHPMLPIGLAAGAFAAFLVLFQAHVAPMTLIIAATYVLQGFISRATNSYGNLHADRLFFAVAAFMAIYGVVVVGFGRLSFRSATWHRLDPVVRLSSIAVACTAPLLCGLGWHTMLVVALYIGLANFWLAYVRWQDDDQANFELELGCLVVAGIVMAAMYVYFDPVAAAAVSGLCVIGLVLLSAHDSQKIGQAGIAPISA